MKDVIRQWLAEKVSVIDVETGNLTDGQPFGDQQRKWERLKEKIAAGDELWEFCSPPESWAHRMGRQGYAVVRKGQVIEFFMTSSS